MKRTLPALAALLAVAVAGCGGDDEPAAKAPSPSATSAGTGNVLDLSKGSAVTVPAPDRAGVVTDRTPVQLTFTDVECADRLPGIGFDDENRNTDLVAGKGQQLCLVAVAVKNVGPRKNFFSSRTISRLVAEDGKAYPVTEQNYDYQAIADARGQRLASTSDLIKPGATKYDYAVYELPADAEPQSVRYDVATVG